MPGRGALGGRRSPGYGSCRLGTGRRRSGGGGIIGALLEAGCGCNPTPAPHRASCSTD